MIRIILSIVKLAIPFVAQEHRSSGLVLHTTSHVIDFLSTAMYGHCLYNIEIKDGQNS